METASEFTTLDRAGTRKTEAIFCGLIEISRGRGRNREVGEGDSVGPVILGGGPSSAAAAESFAHNGNFGGT